MLYVNIFSESILLMLILYVGNQLVWYYFDFLVENENNDFPVVHKVWDILITHPILEKIEKLILWSDGGPKHFKISKNLYYLSTIKHTYNKEVIYNFFTSYHGHSLCDAHAGVSKRKVK